MWADCTAYGVNEILELPLNQPTQVQQKPEQTQKVSDYEREKKDSVTIILIIILIALLLGLIAVFIFKRPIVEFLNSLF